MSAHSSSSASGERGEAVVNFVAGARTRTLPPEVIDIAKKALVDYIGVGIGARGEPLAGALTRTVADWHAAGDAFIILGSRTTPALAALVNGTLVHAVEYDDQHPNGSGHPSAPCWSTALAVGAHHHLSEEVTLRAFVTGYEITAKLGGGGPGGVGRTLQKRGFHPTSMFGRIGAAAATCVMLGHEPEQIRNAIGIAATTAGGLLASFGTHCKPFHAGKSAMDGILAAQLAREGFDGAHNTIELEGGLAQTFLGDVRAEVPPLDLGERWDILRNGFKYFACCRATHSSTQSACALAGEVRGREIARIRARVHANALVTAAKTNPQTPFECKFSTAFCIAMGLRGYKALMSDFSERTMQDKEVTRLVPLVELEAVPGRDSHTADLDVWFTDGSHVSTHTDCVKGHPDNPMSWEDLRTKFDALVAPALGAKASEELYLAARNFEQPGCLARISELLSART